jgi:OmpA-OmpF porin, OOP family
MKRASFSKILIAAVAISMSGCALQSTRSDGSFNPLCTLAGAVVGGGGAAAVSLAAGPVGAGILVGAMLGSVACTEDPLPEPSSSIAVVVPTPLPQPIIELDSDDDGITDRLDDCPNTPGGTTVNPRGCPGILLTLAGINFKFDSSQIEPESDQVLDQLVAALTDAAAVEVRIEGHTDSVGTEVYNLELSHRRANAVRDYLNHYRINAARLTTEGKGETQPIMENTTADGRYQNRRVEIHVVDSRAAVNPIARWRKFEPFFTCY